MAVELNIDNMVATAVGMLISMSWIEVVKEVAKRFNTSSNGTLKFTVANAVVITIAAIIIMIIYNHIATFTAAASSKGGFLNFTM